MTSVIGSVLETVVKGFKQPVKKQALENELKRKGVKPLEIEQSRILEHADNMNEGDLVNPEELNLALGFRQDKTTVVEKGVNPATDAPHPSSAKFSSYTVPNTNKLTYRERVYSNKASAVTGGTHHAEPDQVFWTRGDVVTEIDPQFAAGPDLNDNPIPTYGDSALRIQEIQSDVYNRQIADAKAGEIDYTIDKGQVEHIIDSNEAVLKEVEQSGYDKTDTLAALELQAVQDGYGVNESAAKRILDDFYAGDVDRIRIDNDVDFESLDLSEERRDFVKTMVDNQELQTWYRDEPEIAYNIFLTAKYDLSNQQASVLATQMTNPASAGLSLNPQVKPKKLQIPYIKQALYHELDYAQEQGLREVQIAIAPEGKAKLERSKGVQKNYETTVRKTAEKVAKQIGAEVSYTKGWLILGLPATFSLPLYAAEGEPELELNQKDTFLSTAMGRGVPEQEAKDSYFTNKAREMGASEEQIQGMLAQQSGGDGVVQAEPQAQMTQRDRREARSSEYEPFDWGNFNESMNNIMGFGPDPAMEEALALNPEFDPQREDESTVDYGKRIGQAYMGTPTSFGGLGPSTYEQTYQRVQGRSKDLLANAIESMQVTEPINEIKAAFGNAESIARQETLNKATADYVVPFMESRGVPIRYDGSEYWVTDENGNEFNATPGMLKDLYGDKFEIAGDIAGAVSGATLAASMLHPYGKIIRGIGYLGGTFLGGAIGSVVGTELDYINNYISTHESLNADMAFAKAEGAAKASLFYTSLGELGIVAFKGAFGLGKWAGGMTQRVNDGNLAGAVDYTMEFQGVTREEAEEVVALWENINATSAPGRNMDEKILSILPTTRAGGEDIIAAVAEADPRASGAVQREVNERAQSLLDESNKVSSVDGQRKVLEGLRTYHNETGEFLAQAKLPFLDADTSLVEKLDLTDSIDNAYNTVIQKGIDPQNLEWLTEIMSQIERVSQGVASGEDLLELRAMINSVKYKSFIQNKKALESLDVVRNSIDSQIDKVARTNMSEEEATEWLQNWKVADRAYSEMLTVEANGLFNALTKFTTGGKAVTPDTVAQALIKYGTSIDDAFIVRGGKPVNTYTEVINALDIETVREVEGSIVSGLTEKYTIGSLDNFRATQFPELSKEMNKYTFRTPEAQRVQSVVEEMAKLYKNDVGLATATGRISQEAFQHYLTTNPIVRVKFAVASQVFNFASSLTGGSKADSRAMINLVGKLLEEPLNAKTTKAVMHAVKEDQALTQAITEFQQRHAQGVADGTITPSVKVRTYRDKRNKIWTQPGRNRRPVSATVPGRSIAREDYVKDRYGLAEVSMNNLSKLDKAELINEGFDTIALETGELVRIFE